ncbi:hypothetical protein L208DRAFT_1449016 [Tricholoma matsutake]|nr:hypothetical protein L208DRAFT_1449016 [Tricholoma matsutake 945]
MAYSYKYSGKKKLKREICSSSPSPSHTYRLYAKFGGKAGKHCWVSDSSNIAAVSNIPVQLFDHILGVQFRAIPVTV